VLGDAVGLAIQLFETSEVSSRVLIVLSDGDDTGSRVPPVEAAKVARQKGITLYNVAIGDPETTGNEALDMETLERMGDITDGATFTAMDLEGLEAAYARIDALEPDTFETLSFRPRHSLHHWPLMVLVGVTLLLTLGRAFLTLRPRPPLTRHV
jgi:Ca-activated chloride channel family protein